MCDVCGGFGVAHKYCIFSIVFFSIARQSTLETRDKSREIATAQSVPR